ncbi:MAG: divergent polysaccharide deacetylase family protein [Pseudomonadales bacterium]
MAARIRARGLGVGFAGVLLSAMLLVGCSEEEPPEAEAPLAEQTDTGAMGEVLPSLPVTLECPVPVADPLVIEDIVLEPAEQAFAEAPAPAAQIPKLSIIIDDIGHNLAAGERVIALPGPVALAIMPFTRNAQALARLAAAAGKPVMLHLPMENMAGLAIGEGGLNTQMERVAFDAQLQASLNAFSPIQGVNNHMGSKLTADRERMDWLMARLDERKLFFVDSRTTKDTQAAFAAQAKGVASVSRDIFLDNQRNDIDLEREFKLVLARARKQGSAVLIGHPYPETLRFLERRLPELEAKEGVRLVSVQMLLSRALK